MIVLPESRALLFQFADPQAALQQIPFGQLIDYEGKQYVVCPHHEDSVKYLRNIGMRVPGMMTYYYDWPGPFKPFYHQRVTAEFIVENPRCFVLNDIGTGKTMSTAWALDYMMRKMMVNKVVIGATKSTLREVWEAEIARVNPGARIAVCHGSPEKRKKLLAGEYDYFIFTHEGLKWYLKFQHPDVNCIVIDELAEFSNGQSQRWKALDKLIKPGMRVIGLTGQPCPTSPTDAWAQAKVMKTGFGDVPKYFGRFQREVMQQVSTYKWIPLPGWERRVHGLLQPAVRFTRDECLDLPPTTYSNRTVELTDVQQQVYNLVKKDLYAEYESGKIVAANEMIKTMRLVQVASGVVYDIDQNHLTVGAEPRIEEVKRIFSDANRKLILYAPYRGTVEYIYEHLKGFARCAVVHGDISMGKRAEIFRTFQSSDDIELLIAHPGCMAHGLTLTRSATIAWFAPVNSNRWYTQANGRIVRAGQDKHTHIIHIYATPEERRMYKALQYQQSMEGILLVEFEKGTKSWLT